MDDREAIRMMKRCAAEIKLQRNTINALEPQARAFQVIEQVLGYLPHGTRGMSEDMVWVLEKRIAELEAKEANDAQNS